MIGIGRHEGCFVSPTAGSLLIGTHLNEYGASCNLESPEMKTGMPSAQR
jgi:hypothetical protein